MESGKKLKKLCRRIICWTIFYCTIVIGIDAVTINAVLLLIKQIAKLIEKFDLSAEKKLGLNLSISIPLFSSFILLLWKTQFGVLIVDNMWVYMQGPIIRMKHLDSYVAIKAKIIKQCEEYNIATDHHQLLNKIDSLISNYLLILKYTGRF